MIPIPRVLVVLAELPGGVLAVGHVKYDGDAFLRIDAEDHPIVTDPKAKFLVVFCQFAHIAGVNIDHHTIQRRIYPALDPVRKPLRGPRCVRVRT